MDSVIIFLHSLLPLLCIVDLLAVYWKAKLMKRYCGITAGDFFVSFFILYNKSGREMYGSKRRRKFMLANNRVNYFIYSSIILFFLLLLVYGSNIFKF